MAEEEEAVEVDEAEAAKGEGRAVNRAELAAWEQCQCHRHRMDME
jgi:hypothetical protein